MKTKKVLQYLSELHDLTGLTFQQLVSQYIGFTFLMKMKSPDPKDEGLEKMLENIVMKEKQRQIKLKLQKTQIHPAIPSNFYSGEW